MKIVEYKRIKRRTHIGCAAFLILLFINPYSTSPASTVPGSVGVPVGVPSGVAVVGAVGCIIMSFGALVLTREPYYKIKKVGCNR